MEKEIEKAIRETLVIGNPQSIHIAVKKILLLFNVSGRSEQFVCLCPRTKEDNCDMKEISTSLPYPNHQRQSGQIQPFGREFYRKK